MDDAVKAAGTDTDGELSSGLCTDKMDGRMSRRQIYRSFLGSMCMEFFVNLINPIIYGLFLFGAIGRK